MWRGRRMICPQGLCIPAENNKPVPLKNIQVETSIQGFVCKVTSTLLYENVEDEAIEALFVFPMDDDSAVYQFEAEIDDRKIVAECQDSEEAQQTYDDAVSQGYTSVLLGQDPNSADIFQCSIGNLASHKSATIRFSYVKELPLTLDGGVQFVLPTILNPRYNPAPEDGGATDSKLGNAASVPPNKVPYTFLFEAVVRNEKQILNVKSDHEDVSADVAEDKTSAVLTLKKDFSPDHDLSFVVYYDKIYEPNGIFAQGNENENGILKSNVLMLNFFPELDEKALHGEKEFIFIMDRSGSMGGPRMISAKETLLLFLKSLPADCYFNIVSFGSRHQFLFQNGSQKYSEDSLNEALTLQRDMEADFGGTEILRPLQDIYDRPLIEGYPRQCFVLTDGQVSNVNAVIALVKKNVEKSRVFTFGIGEGASTALVKGLARAGHGKAMFVKDEERLQPKVMKILKCAMQDTVKDLKLDIQGSEDAKVVPQPVPPLYSGDCLVLYAIIPGSTLLQTGTAVLSGTLGDEEIKFSVPLNSAKPTTDLAIQRLAAKAQISQLEGDEDGSGTASSKDMIVLLSTSANIVSKYTSMVGVDTEKGGNSAPKKRQIPTPSNYQQKRQMRPQFACPPPPPAAMMGAMMSCPAPMGSMAGPPPQIQPQKMCSKSAQPSRRMRRAPPPPPPLSGGAPPSNCAPGYSRGTPPPPPPPSGAFMPASDSVESKPPKVVGYMKVVNLQSFSGEWQLDEVLATVLSKTLEELRKTCPQVDEKVWATALAVSFLRSNYATEHEEWEMVEMKALQWLAKGKINTKEVLGEAMKIIK